MNEPFQPHMNRVAITLEGLVLRVTLRRPEARNALDADSISALLQAFEQAESSTDARAILLEAEGPVFSMGLEVSEALLTSTIGKVRSLAKLLTFGQHCSKPIVAAIQGAALGAGAILAAGAHVALAAQGTSFGFTDIRSGQWPYAGWSVIEHALGYRRGLELTMTGRVFSAHDALAWGLIHEITQPSELEDRAMATATLLAAAPPDTVASVLNWLRDPQDPCRAALENLQSADAREGLAAFLERRRPVWPPKR